MWIVNEDFIDICSLHIYEASVVVFPTLSYLSVIRPKITCLDFKKSKLTLVVVEDDDQVTLRMFCHCVAAKHCLNFYACCLVKLTDVTIDPPTCRGGEKILNCTAESKAAVCFKIRNAEGWCSIFCFSVSSGSGGRKNENQSIIYRVSRRPTSPQAKQNSWPESKQEGSVQNWKKKTQLKRL